MVFDPIHDWPREGTPEEVAAALSAAGYDPDARPRGITGDPAYSHVTPEGVRIRNHVCQIDGLEIDGHGGYDLDPGSTACRYCEYEGSNP